MTASMTTARDEMHQMFLDAWNAQAASVTPGGYIPAVRWYGTEVGDLPDSTKAWARVAVQHLSGDQCSFGSVGQRKFERTGTVTVQIFTPILGGQGLSLAEQLAKIARDAYEGKATTSEVWFRQVTVREALDADERAWFQMNVVAIFEYEEIK